MSDKIPAFRGGTSAGPAGSPILSGGGGGAVTAVWGTGADADRIVLDGTPGPHLTGPAGAPGVQGPPGTGTGSSPLVVGIYDRVITDPPFNALADHGVTDNSAAIQAAVDAVAAAIDTANPAFTGAGRVIVPPSTGGFGIRHPVYIDHGNIEICGVDSSSYLIPMVPMAALVFSEYRRIPVTSGGVTVYYAPVVGNRVDSSGVLDATAAPTTGQRWGFRTMGSCYGRFIGSPPMCGVREASGPQSDNWGSVQRLTLEWMMVCAAGKVTSRAPIFGLGGGDPYFCCPFVIEGGDADDKVNVTFRTDDVYDGETGTMNYYRIAQAVVPAGGVLRMAVQIDLVAKTLAVFANGHQIAWTSSQNMGDGHNDFYPWVANSHFSRNDTQPFMLGSNGVGSTNGATGMDVTFHGLRASRVLRYQQNGVGTVQTKAAGGTPTDTDAYFTDDADTVFYFPFTDPPSTSREFTVQAGGAAFAGPCIGTLDNAIDPPGLNGQAVRNLRVSGGSNYGVSVLKGKSMGFWLDTVSLQGGYAAYLVNPRFANYYDEIHNCDLYGTDCSLSFWNTLARISNLNIEYSGRVTVRSHCSAYVLNDIFVQRSSIVTTNIFKMCGAGYGGAWTIRGVEVDYEGDQMTGPLAGGFYVEACGDTPVTLLTLEDCYLSTLGPAACALRLRDMADPISVNLGPANVVIVNPLFTDANCLAAIELDGPRWRADVQDARFLKGQAVIRHTGRWGADCNVVVHDRELNAVPTTGAWVKGGHVIHKSSPSPGDPSAWVCVVSGTFGTGTVPRFAPVGVVGAMI